MRRLSTSFRIPAPACLILALTASAALLGASCSDDPFRGNLPPTDITPPTLITETFDGTLTVNGAITHPFVSRERGVITAVLAATEPADVSFGLSLGTWNGASCQIVVANDNITLNGSVVGQAQGVGNFCVRVYDVGKLTGPVSYQVALQHY